jgi:hypothetical protein
MRRIPLALEAVTPVLGPRVAVWRSRAAGRPSEDIVQDILLAVHLKRHTGT